MKPSSHLFKFFVPLMIIAAGSSCTKKTGGQCTYSTDPHNIKIEWTAFKFTTKAPVKGTFNTMNVSGPNTAKSLAGLMKGLKMDINGASIESGDPGRNITVRDFFFGKFNPPFTISAAATKVTGDDTHGNVLITLSLNGVSKEVPFAYTAKEDGSFEAKSAIDMMNFNLKPAFDSLHQACEVQHTGEDGVSKTWPDVDLKITAKFTKECS